MKKLFVLLAVFALLATATNAGVTVKLKGNVKVASVGDVTFFYEKEELAYADTNGHWPVIIHEELAERLGPADWTIVAFSGGNIVLMKETNTGFDYYHLLHRNIECLPYTEYDSLALIMLKNELEPGDTINFAWEQAGIDFFANHFQLLRRADEETAQFRRQFFT